MNTYIYMDVSLSIITNFILQQNCFICLQRFGHQSQKKQSLSEFDQLAKIDLWFIVSLLDHSPLTIIHSQNSVLLEKCTLGNQRGQQSVLRARNQCSVFFLHRPFLFDVWDVGCRHRFVGVLCLCFTKSISIARSEYLETISKKITFVSSDGLVQIFLCMILYYTSLF